VEAFAHQRNIERFRRVLKYETDAARRTLIEGLLNEELVQLDRVRREKRRDR